MEFGCYDGSTDSTTVTEAHSVRDVDNGEGHAWVKVGSIWAISVPSPGFCCEFKIALKV